MQRIRIESPRRWMVFLFVGVFTSAFGPAFACAAEKHQIELGSYQMSMPGEWQPRQPRSNIVRYEFAVEPAEGDERPGRVTVMAAGGSVEQNIERWFGQFKQPDGGPTKEAAKVEKKTVAGQKVHLVDISGIFNERARPFGPGVDRKGYRMLGAIIVTDEAQIFVKFTGPEKTVAAHADGFRQAIEGMTKR